MPVPSTEAKIVSREESTIDHSQKIATMVVDPGYDGSFTVDLEKMKQNAVKVPPRDSKSGLSRDAALTQALRSMAADTQAAPRVGRATPTLDGGNHDHHAAQLPANVVAPPQTRVHFDIPGYASMAFKYHSVKRVDGYLVFVTDRRFAGTADFYPYTQKMAAETGKPMGAYVEGGKKMYMLKPSSIVFHHEPFEFCLVPVHEERPLPPELAAEFAQEELRGPDPARTREGPSHGEASSDRGGADAPGEWPELEPADPPDPEVREGGREIDVDSLGHVAGGGGSVL